MPTVSRRELDSDDIVSAFGLVKMRGPAATAFGNFDSMCRGKSKFETKERADRMTRRKKGLVSFRCRFCHSWHIGNHLDK